MCSTLDRVDVVRKREDVLVVGLVELERDLDLHGDLAVAARIAPLARNEDWRCVERCARAIQMLDKRDDPALVAEVVALARAFVADLDPQTRIQKGEFAKPLGEHVEREIRQLEDFGVWRKGDARPGVFGGADLLDT